jgi:hypothetical protein
VFRALADCTALDLLTDGRSAKPAEVTDDVPMPEHSRLLRIALEQAELLELRDHSHRRRRWRRRTGWSEEQLNP